MYKSSALIQEHQDDFLNAVGVIETSQSPEDVYAALHSIEESLNKNPPYPFGPRTIDLDVLLYDDLVLDTVDLTIPHPRLHERRFVLEPLSELVGKLDAHPIHKKTYHHLLETVQHQQCSLHTITL